VGFGEAARLAKAEMATENERVRALRDRLWNGIKDMEEVYVNGDLERRIPHNLNVSFNFVEGESLIMAVKDIAVSSGSACTSASLEPFVRAARLGRNDELAAQLDPHHPGPLHHRGRSGLRRAAHPQEGGEAARALAALGDVQGRHRLEYVQWAAH
jgi:hypothetical protein